MIKKLLTMVLFGAIIATGCKTNSEQKEQTIVLKKNWQLQQSSKVDADGAKISTKAYVPNNWYAAHVPSTVMGVLSQLPEYSNLFMGENYYAANKEIFNESWWYRKTFSLNKLSDGQRVILQFDGLSYYANIWLNGKNIATKNDVFGTFRRFEFDITKLANEGENILAVEVFKQQPGDFGHGFVDWNPRPLDENMGIWRDVTVKIIDKVQLKNTFVRSKVNTTTLDEAWLTIGTELKNYSNETLDGKLKVSFNNSSFSVPVTIKAGKTETLVLNADNYSELHLTKPKLWWCNLLGDPNMYALKIEFEQNNTVKASDSVRFGIREIETYFNQEGHRGFKLNGKEILIKGAGWTDDIFLRDTEKTNEIQIELVKRMGMNTIRFENIWGTTQNIYDLCDEHGILAMVGWSCQWEWENYLGKACDNFGGISTPSDIQLVTQYMNDQLLWLRNHPSIFVWLVGSDMLPRPELEKKYIALFDSLDNRPWLSAASGRESELTGPTGVKMVGPYEYVGPSYWYVDKKFGGAYGFNTETGPGPQLPVVESIRKMITASQLWPLNAAWDKHCTTSSAGMNSLGLLNQIVSAQYGNTVGFDDFVRKSHLSNYEALRAMLEAFRANRPKTTGIIQWMLNSAWPSFYWQVYDYNLIPTPAYYGAKKALQPIQLIFNYGSREVVLSNETLLPKPNCKVEVKVYTLASKLLFEKAITVAVAENKSENLFKLPNFNELCFVEMKLIDENNELIADNFYWLSDVPEKFDWENTNWYYTPMKQYANYQTLVSLPKVKPLVNYSLQKNDREYKVSIELNNTNVAMAFFTELKLKTVNEEWIVPAWFSDNYISILPNTSKKIELSFPIHSIEGYSEVYLSIDGWNTEQQLIKIDL